MSIRRILRYEVPVDDQPHTHALTSGPWHVTARDIHTIEFWAEHDDDAEQHERVFQVVGTGQPLPDGAIWRDTADRTPEGFVWHLVELIDPNAGKETR